MRRPHPCGSVKLHGKRESVDVMSISNQLTLKQGAYQGGPDLPHGPFTSGSEVSSWDESEERGGPETRTVCDPQEQRAASS